MLGGRGELSTSMDERIRRTADRMIVEAAELGVTGPEIECAVRGIAELFEPMKDMPLTQAPPKKTRRQLIRELNDHPVNRAAAIHLPSGCADRDEVNLVALLRLALLESEIRFKDIDEDEMESTIATLEAIDPRDAMAFLLSDEARSQSLEPEDLTALTTVEAMDFLIELLHDLMVELGW